MGCGNKTKRKIAQITNAVDAAVREYAGYALSISTNIKAMLDSPLANLVTQVIPGTWDDELKAKGTVALGKAIDDLCVSIKMAETPNLEDKLKLFTEWMAGESKSFKESQFKKIADLVTGYMDEKKLASHFYEATTLATLLVENKPAPEEETHED